MQFLFGYTGTGWKSWILAAPSCPRIFTLRQVTTDWQLPLSGVHFSMMEKLAQPGEGGGGCTPTTFHYIYPHVQSCGVYTLQLRVLIHSPYFFLLYPCMYSVVHTTPNTCGTLGPCVIIPEDFDKFVRPCFKPALTKTKYWKLETNIPRKGIARTQSQFPQSCACERFIYSNVGLSILLQENMWTNPANILIAHRHIKVRN